MRHLFLKIFLLLATITAGYASPDDTSLSRQILGTWQGGRHAVQYLPNGTWRFAPKDGTTHGAWKIANGQLVESWRFTGDTKDTSAAYTIISITNLKLIVRGQDGTTFTSSRIK